jgi:dihydroceramidase
MHLLTTPLLYRILSFKASPERTRLVGIILSVLFTIVMVVHVVMDEFLLHAVSFGLAVYMIATRTSKIISQQVPDPCIRKKLRNISFFGICMAFPVPRVDADANRTSLLWLGLFRVAH